MELGKTSMKESNVNGLSKAVHPRHGLVWSDGKAIYLGALATSGGVLQNTPSTRLGEFENVESVCWSRDIDATTCFMSVVHQNNVTVWKVSGAAPKLSFKQVRKINVRPVQQGILWNPKCDVLCLFSRDQVSFYFNHLGKKGSYAFPPLVSGKITCGCWSSDCNKLLVCVGSSLLIYTWPNIENSLSDFTPSAWTLPKSDGNVTAIVPISRNKYVCCVDLPLERLCQNKDVFLMPELPTNPSQTDPHDKIKDGLLKANNSSSIKENLLNLPRNPESIVNDSSQLVYFQIHNDARSSVKLNTESLQGLISPDLLCFEASGCVVVGSNSQNQLHVFTLTDSHLTKTSEIILGKSERPKGLCSATEKSKDCQNGVFVLVGKPEKKDPLFPSASSESQYELSVRFFRVTPDRSIQHHHSHSGLPDARSTKLKSHSDVKSKSISESALQKVHVTSNNTDDLTEKKINIHIENSNTRHPTKSLIASLDGTQDNFDSLETFKTNFKDVTPRFKNDDLESVKEKSAIRENKQKSQTVNTKSTCNSGTLNNTENNVNSVNRNQVVNGVNGPKLADSKPSSKSDVVRNVDTLEDSLSDLGLPSNSLSTCSDENYEFLERVVESQKDQIEELQKKVQNLSQLVDKSSLVSETKYQTPNQPDSVKVTCLYENGSSVTRKFLLDCGRIQLDALKKAFRLDYVELVIDDEPMILGANIDGYIPLKFTPGSNLKIIGENSEMGSSNEDLTPILRKDPKTGATKC